MTNQPHPTPPRFHPVPALPIVVWPAPKGVRVLATAAGMFAGATFSEAIGAATSTTPPTPEKDLA